VYLVQAVDDHDRRRRPPQRSTGLIEEELMDRKNPEPLWTPTQVATYLGVPVQTLYQWRRKHTGPPARRVGRHLRYDPSTVQAWFAALGDGVA
jgi:excisionase family DNA binding protein